MTAKDTAANDFEKEAEKLARKFGFAGSPLAVREDTQTLCDFARRMYERGKNDGLKKAKAIAKQCNCQDFCEPRACLDEGSGEEGEK